MNTLVAGKTVTGFSNIEEDYGDTAAGVKVMPWRLVTGQQQYSARAVAKLVIEMLGV